MSFIKRNLHYFFVSIVILISAVSMIGWWIREPLLIQVHMDYAPIVFNTALVFFVLGIGFFTERLENKKISEVCSAFSLIVGTLTLFQYLAGVNVGIDELFLKAYYKTGVYAPGRMAFSTATCFVLLGAVGFLRNLGHVYRFVSLALSTLVFGFGSIGLISYVLVFSSEYGWGSFARMAIMTAAAFIFYSAARIWQINISVRRSGTSRRVLIPFYVLFIGVLTSVLIWQMLVLRDLERNRSVTNIRAESLRKNIDNSLGRIERALTHMALRFSKDTYKNLEMWTTDAIAYQKEFKAIRRLVKTDEKNIARWLYPKEDPNYSLQDVDITFRPQVAEKIIEAKTTRKTAITDVFVLRGATEGFVFIVPIFKKDSYAGVISVSLLVDAFLEMQDELPGYRISIFEGQNKIYSSGAEDPSFARDWTSQISYKNYGMNWKIEVTPSQVIIRENTSALPAVVLVFGLCISTLLGLALHFYSRILDSEHRAHEISEWKSAVMDSASLLMVSLDQDLKIREMNRRAQEMFGYTNAELAGKVTPMIFHDAKEVEDFIRKAEAMTGERFEGTQGFVEALMSSGYIKASEWTLRKKDGSTFIGILSASEVKDETGEVIGYLGLIEDVTDARQREKLLKEQEQRILVSSRLASLGEMAAGIAHEINNPLTIINGHIGMLRRQLSQKGLNEDPDIERRIGSIDGMVTRITKIIKGLKSFARESDDGDKEITTVSYIVEDTLSFCHEKFKMENIELDLDIQSGLKVYVRTYQISQVLLNLLNNAYDAIKNSEVKRIKIAAIKKQEGVEISVEDSGPGIPNDLKEKILQPFFTTKEVGQGIGLGLSISQGIVQSHDGKFYLDERSKHTRFVMWLPDSL